MRRPLPPRSRFGELWDLSDDVCFLNHGSFGACPREVLAFRESLVRELESEPMDFLVRRLPALLAEQTAFLEEFLSAWHGSVVLVPNATAGVNTVLRSLRLGEGDEVIVAGSEYFSTRNSALFNAGLSGAVVRTVPLPFPVADPAEVSVPLLSAVGPRTRLVILDHISSPTAIVLDVRSIVRQLADRGVEVLVDGAHGPGGVPLALEEIGAAYYTGNCHKWLCSPKVCAVLCVRPDMQSGIHPLSISHLRADLDSPLSDFQLEFMWNGTPDPAPALSVKRSVEFMGSLLPGGWAELMERNRAMAREAGIRLARALGEQPPSPESMSGPMSAVCLPWVEPPSPPGVLWLDPLQVWLREEKGIEIPVTWTSSPRRRILRLSAQLYNSPEEYDYLVQSVLECPRLRR